MQTTGVDAAIQELEQEVKRMQEAIGMLRAIYAKRGGTVSRKTRRLSAQGRKKISEAARKRWAAYRKKKTR